MPLGEVAKGEKKEQKKLTKYSWAGEEERRKAFTGAPRPSSGFYFLPRIGELQETLLDMTPKSQDGEFLDESQWDLAR